jgi:hypothetical protein
LVVGEDGNGEVTWMASGDGDKNGEEVARVREE